MFDKCYRKNKIYVIQFNQKLIKINILKVSMKFKKKNYTSQVDEMDCGCAALSMIFKILWDRKIACLSSFTCWYNNRGNFRFRNKKSRRRFRFCSSSTKS